ncbi:MAG TPA: MmgE/PrpD family protein [Candidatus Acidoferrales bacterium]|nr:MmgE/PrpD family protein [Candidatus Acidoferrales bacterium]
MRDFKVPHSVQPSRRRALQLVSGLLVPAGALPQQPASGDPMSTLSTYMSEAAGRKLPDAVVEKTSQMILDTLAAMISGSQLPPGRFAIQFARGYRGAPVATVAASNVVCGPIEAALANGMLAHADETDDTHPPSQSHPGCSVVPAALAAGERFAGDGTRFLRAVALGYDIGTRVTITLGKLQYMVETHRSTHSISGNFGSAAAAGCMAGLNTRQMRWLLSYAAQQASGLASWQRDTEHVEKAFDFGGMPARNGVTAALLVQAGASAVDDILFGRDNFWQAFVPRNDAALMVEKLGERYEIMRTNVKKWSVGAPIQAPLDALDNLQKRWRFEPEQVKRVVVLVATDEAAIVNNREIPDICLQHLIAVMLIDRTVTFQSAHAKERMQDPAVLRHRAKVELVPDEALERLMPRREAVVELTLMDGRVLSERVGNVRGTAENPMSRQELIAKATDLITPVLGPAKCRNLVDTIFGLERVADIRTLRPLMQSA